MRSPMLATSFRWRSGSHIHTSVVAKIALTMDGKGTPIAPLPIVAFDRAGTPGRLSEVSELAPWTTVASVVAYDVGYRFSLETSQGPLVVQPAGEGVGVAMSAPERARFSATPPRRGADKLLMIDEGVDGRFFIGAPSEQQFAEVRGNERFVFESARGRFAGALPGLVVAATVAVGGARRRLRLTPDLVVVHSSGCLQLVSRATIEGEGTTDAFTLLSLEEAAALDRGDGAPPFATASSAPSPARPAPAGKRGSVSTAELNLDALRRMSGNVPFAAPARNVEARETPRPAATPFDRGFAPADVAPGIGLDSTADPATALDSRVIMAEVARLREAAGLPPLGSANQTPAPKPTQQQPPREQQPIVAPPRAGAMAKPRFKKR